MNMTARCCRALPAALITTNAVYRDNPLIGTLKPQSNGQLYSNTVIGKRPLMGRLLYLVQQEVAGRAVAPPSPLLAVPNVTTHSSTAIVPTSYYSMRHYKWRGGLVVGRRTCDLVVAGSRPGRDAAA